MAESAAVLADDVLPHEPMCQEWHSECGGAVKVIACIDDPVVIKKILAHWNGKATSETKGLLPEGPGRHLSACNAQAGKPACSTHQTKETNHSAQIAAIQA